jgi:hypothetical protein
MKTNKDERKMDLPRFTIEVRDLELADDEIDPIRNDISKAIARGVHATNALANPHGAFYQQMAPRP